MATKRKKERDEAGAPSGSGNVALGKLSAALDDLFKGESIVVDFDPSQLKEPMPHIGTGSTVIDYVIGGLPNRFGVSPCPGIPKGKITQIWGSNHSGKTTVCLEVAAEVIRRGGGVVYIDWEFAIDPAYASYILGVPVSDKNHFMWCQPDTLERGMQIALAAAAAGTDLIVIDSVGAAILKVQDEAALKDLGQGTGGAGMGAAARKWGEFLPKIKKMCAKMGSSVLAISQTRSKIGGMSFMGPQESPQGGKSWEFYADLRFNLAKIKTLKRKERNALTNKVEEMPYANIVKVKIAKCKLAASTNREGQFYLRYGEGIDDLWSLIDLAKAYGLVKGSSWLTWTRADGDIRGQGLEGFRQVLEDTPELVVEFKRAILPLLANQSAAGVSGDDEGFDEDDVLMKMMGDDEEEDQPEGDE